MYKIQTQPTQEMGRKLWRKRAQELLGQAGVTDVPHANSSSGIEISCCMGKLLPDFWRLVVSSWLRWTVHQKTDNKAVCEMPPVSVACSQVCLDCSSSSPYAPNSDGGLIFVFFLFYCLFFINRTTTKSCENSNCSRAMKRMS